MEVAQVELFMDQLLTVEQLAQVLHKTPSSVRSDASRNSKSLPPICRLPGSKRLLWRAEDVRNWIASFVEQSPETNVRPVIAQTSGRRGRPRKTELRV